MAVPNPTITPTGTVLALVGDPLLRDDVSRVAAAAGVGLVVVDEPSGRKAWMAAAAVVLDAPSAQRCAARALPRRTRVILVGSDAPRPDDWQAAIAQLAIDFRASGVPIAALSVCAAPGAKILAVSETSAESAGRPLGS